MLATLLDILQTRLQIISTEFEEERERLRELAVYGFWALFFTSLGIVFVMLFVVTALWESYRLHALGARALTCCWGSSPPCAYGEACASARACSPHARRVTQRPRRARSRTVNRRLAATLRRRERLVARAAEQRAAVAAIARPWRRPLVPLGTGVRLFRAARRQPVLIAVAAMLLTRTRYARLAWRIGRAATLWQLYRAVTHKRTTIHAGAQVGKRLVS